MNKFIIYRLSFIVLLAMASCAKPKVIPDGKLAQIFHDIYLTNAYVGTSGTINPDSLNIYEPVFARYGYTSRDVQYTIGNFSKRKSARIGDIVDHAIDMLFAENNFLQHRISVADTLALIARERYGATIYSDSLIRVTRTRDTARLNIKLPVEAGDYAVDYDYFVDSADHNQLDARHYLLSKWNRPVQQNTRRLRNFSQEHVHIDFAVEPIQEWMVLDLNGYGKGMSSPGLKIENLTVKRYPDKQTALDSMARGLLGYYETMPYETISVTPPFRPEGATSAR